MAIATCSSALNDRALCTSIALTRYDELTCGPFHRSRGRAGQARCCNPTGSNRPRAVVFETAISYRLMGLPVPKPRCPAVARLNPEGDSLTIEYRDHSTTCHPAFSTEALVVASVSARVHLLILSGSSTRPSLPAAIMSASCRFHSASRPV